MLVPTWMGKRLVTVVIGVLLAFGLVLSACKREESSQLSLEDAVKMLTPPVGLQLTEPHRYCTDVLGEFFGNSTCYMSAHYLIQADADSLQESIERLEIPHNSFSTVDGSYLFTSINLHTSHTLAVNGQETLHPHRLDAVQWFLGTRGTKQEIIISWYGTAHLEGVTFDAEAVHQNIVEINVRTK